MMKMLLVPPFPTSFYYELTGMAICHHHLVSETVVLAPLYNSGNNDSSRCENAPCDEKLEYTNKTGSQAFFNGNNIISLSAYVDSLECRNWQPRARTKQQHDTSDDENALAASRRRSDSFAPFPERRPRLVYVETRRKCTRIQKLAWRVKDDTCPTDGPRFDLMAFTLLMIST